MSLLICNQVWSGWDSGVTVPHYARTDWGTHDMNVARKTSSICTHTHRILDRDDCNWLCILSIRVTANFTTTYLRHVTSQSQRRPNNWNFFVGARCLADIKAGWKAPRKLFDKLMRKLPVSGLGNWNVKGIFFGKTTIYLVNLVAFIASSANSGSPERWTSTCNLVPSF